MNTEIFNGFLLSAQQESSPEKCHEVPLDVFLMNGYRISINARTSERSEQILEVSNTVVKQQLSSSDMVLLLVQMTIVLVVAMRAVTINKV